MLVNFKFSNFRSFRDETEFSMAAAPIHEHKGTLIDVNGVNILPLAGIYGANASGKSSFFKAFRCMRDTVTNATKKTDSMFPENYNLTMPYLFVGQHDKNDAFLVPSSFEVTLCIDNYAYRYGYTCINNKLLSEWLYKQKISKNQTVEKLIYEVDFKNPDIKIGKVNSTQAEEILYCNSMRSGNNLLLTDLGNRRMNSEFYSILNWFGCAAIITPGDDDKWQYVGEQIICNIIEQNNDDELFCLKTDSPKKEFLLSIREIDPDISDIIIERSSSSSEKTEYTIKTVHETNGEKYTISFNSESDGTRKNLYLTFYLIATLNTGSTLFIDELDSKLHPLVLRKILKMFDDKNINKSGAQLIFSAHNIISLDSSDLRRDEVWFVEKNNQCSSMYSLYDFNDEDDKVRSDLDFGKHYLSGRFGAIPFQNRM